METNILLSFGTTLGRTRTLRINNVRDTLTNVAVRDAMQGIIGTQAVLSPATGLVNTLRSAARVQTQVTPISLGL